MEKICDLFSGIYNLGRSFPLSVVDDGDDFVKFGTARLCTSVVVRVYMQALPPSNLEFKIVFLNLDYFLLGL